MSNFITYTVLGIATGAIYAVAASGLVVTYVTSGVFNVAHGAIGMFMAFTFWELHVHRHLPTIVAFVLVVFVLAPLFGALVERVLMRRLRGATVAQSLVVTVGLMVALLGVAQSIWSPTQSRSVVGFFAPAGFKIMDVFVTWHQAVTVFAGLAVAGFIYVFLNRTRIGVAMRAVVDDRNLAALTGARPDRVSQLSWAIGASLASLAGILLAPILSLNVITLTLLVINAFAAAMMGRLKSLPLTFAGALILGLLESYTVGYVNLSGWLIGLRPALPTLFLFAILLLMPEARLRAGRLIGAATPRIPSLRKSLLGAGLLFGIAWTLSGVLAGSDLVRVTQGLALSIIMLSLVLLTGYGGQVSLCQMTFAGVGAYVMAKTGGGGSPLGLVFAAIAAGGLGALVAIPSLRLQGLYLALSTMAFALLMDKLFFDNVLGLSSAKVGRLDVLGFSFAADKRYFILLAAIFGLLGMFVLALRRGPFGRLLAAMRDSPVACATLGLSLTRTKLAVFTLSAAMAGFAGALYGGALTQAGSVDFVMLQSLPVLLLAVVGGITTVGGALIGGVSFSLLPILQSHFPGIGGLTPLLIGLAAIGIGRNPNGVAFLISERLRKLIPGSKAIPASGATPPSGARPVGAPAEEVRVAAAAS